MCICVPFTLVLRRCLFGLLKKAFPVKNEDQNVTSKTHTILICKNPWKERWWFEFTCCLSVIILENYWLPVVNAGLTYRDKGWLFNGRGDCNKPFGSPYMTVTWQMACFSMVISTCTCWIFRHVHILLLKILCYFVYIYDYSMQTIDSLLVL